ncbi:hypothetical protein HK097_009640 [Rhizophlyctis rosea]|uniref:Major facilitator superfamily (MFS) profile domain-containing protein n=1 Tax=Rhizophlyctis rosea TaxID=64517 RepID=A0AAD5SA90_9FUNG|nr:hypothetical protein HK097_009640 [Rhizophlyctis rosea]
MVDAYDDPTPEEVQLRKKLDLRLLPWAVVGYFVNGLDRNNLPNAAATGMLEDLNMVSNKSVEFVWATTFFFISYVACQVPANMIIPHVRPSIMLPACVLVWGTIAGLMSLVQNHQGLWAARFALGIAEAAFYPGMIYLLGSWYTKRELALRVTVFAAGAQVGSAVSGLISGAIASSLNGAHGIAGWRWMFIIEGIISVIIAVPGFFLIPDYPHNTKWMAQEHRDVALKRMEAQGNRTMYTRYSMTIVRNLFGTPYFFLVLIGFCVCQFLPAMINNFVLALTKMDWDPALANFMTTPVYLFGALTIPLLGFSSDRFRDRFFHCLVGAIVALVWYVLLTVINGARTPTWLLFLAVYGLSPLQGISPIIMTWNNELWRVDNQTRALAIALVNAIGNLAPNFANVKIWLPGDAPVYYLGKVTTMGLIVALIVVVTILGVLERMRYNLPKDKDGADVNETSADRLPEKVVVVEKGGAQA